MKCAHLLLLFFPALFLADFAQALMLGNAILAKSTVTGWFFYLVLFSVAFLVVFAAWYYYRAFEDVEKGASEKSPRTDFWRIAPMPLLNVLVAAIIFGAVVHEGFHFFLMKDPSAITFHIADPENVISICCLQPGEMAFEEIAYGLQLLASFFWVWVNFPLFCKKPGAS